MCDAGVAVWCRCHYGCLLPARTVGSLHNTRAKCPAASHLLMSSPLPSSEMMLPTQRYRRWNGCNPIDLYSCPIEKKVPQVTATGCGLHNGRGGMVVGVLEVESAG